MFVTPELVAMTQDGILIGRHSTNSTRRMQETPEKHREKRVRLDIFDIRVQPGMNSDLADLGITWNVTDFSKNSFIVKVNFE